jgi:hypothetical protein
MKLKKIMRQTSKFNLYKNKNNMPSEIIKKNQQKSDKF